MNRLASPAQLRASLLRWSLFLVPVVLLLGFLSGQVAGSGADNPWFAGLQKPAIYPPAIAFPVAWTILYLLMGLAFAMICSAWGARYRALAIIAFIVQFALNLAWSPAFFGMQDIRLAMAIIVVLDVALLITTILFWRVRRAAGILLLPYLAWVAFATVLNWQIMELNPNGVLVGSDDSVQRFEL